MYAEGCIRRCGITDYLAVFVDVDRGAAIACQDAKICDMSSLKQDSMRIHAIDRKCAYNVAFIIHSGGPNILAEVGNGVAAGSWIGRVRSAATPGDGDQKDQNSRHDPNPEVLPGH